MSEIPKQRQPPVPRIVHPYAAVSEALLRKTECVMSTRLICSFERRYACRSQLMEMPVLGLSACRD